MRVEIGAGEKPHSDYDVHTDILPLPGIDVICRIDELPFADGSVEALRANHVLEHQSWELVEGTVREWARVLANGADVYIGVPDARFIAEQWVRGELPTSEANYWILGGHSDRDAHKGVDERGVPRWIWNAHHTLFDAESLHQVVAAAGLSEVKVVFDGLRNLQCSAVKGRSIGGAP